MLHAEHFFGSGPTDYLPVAGIYAETARRFLAHPVGSATSAE
jgi:hypothetical protein